MKQIEIDILLYTDQHFYFISNFVLVSGINFSKISHEYINILYINMSILISNSFFNKYKVMSLFFFNSMLKNFIILHVKF